MKGKVVGTLFVLLAWSLAGAQEEPLEPAWKNLISFPDEPFASWTAPPYVKFTVVTKPGFDPNVVYFQDSARYEFHFDFALTCLGPGIPPETLDELRARNIRLIYFTTGARECRPTERQDTPPRVRFYGFDEPIECPQ